MLLNLSNHPSTAWSPEQLEAAKQQFSGVVDMPFPNIDPAASIEAIKILVIEYGFKVEQLQPQRPQAVHIMGEMTFVHNFILIMKSLNIPCYASTTERTVLEEADGRKTIQFRFVQFREYS
jgi:hypothetical protein